MPYGMVSFPRDDYAPGARTRKLERISRKLNSSWHKHIHQKSKDTAINFSCMPGPKDFYREDDKQIERAKRLTQDKKFKKVVKRIREELKQKNKRIDKEAYRIGIMQGFPAPRPRSATLQDFEDGKLTEEEIVLLAKRFDQ